MNQEKIKQYIKEAHENAKEKGFYDCPDCKGSGIPDCSDCDYGPINKYNPDACSSCKCDTCKGSGMNPNKNIGELLMLIVSELGEALEAHRKNKFADLKTYDDLILSETTEFNKKVNLKLFENNIKDTFEDEIADVFIRIFDLCGYLKIKPYIPSHNSFSKKENMGEQLLYLCKYCNGYSESYSNLWAGDFLLSLLTFCKDISIDIEKHIQLKMAYNKTRPRKHEKEY